MRHATFAFVLAAASLLTAASAYGQAYRCDSGGTAYLSARPCAAAAKSEIRSYGPARSAAGTRYSAPVSGVPKAEEHLKYLGSGCASISEAIRTGPARGVRGDVIGALNAEYSQKCSLEDQSARKQLQEDRSQEQRQALGQREGATTERQRVRLKLEQCTGMREVLVLKRRRESDLNVKEVEALRGLEKAYNERCVAM
jgi:hypothetical protein